MTDQTVPQSMYHLDSLGCIAINGPDSIKFLQGQITINAEQIIDNQLSLGAICNPQGRCIALFWATQLGESLLFIQMKETIETTIAHLSKYAVFFKCEIQDVSANYTLVGLPPASVKQPNITSTDSIDHHDGAAELLKSSDNKVVIRLLKSDSEATEALIGQAGSDQDWLSLLAQQNIPWLTHSSQSEFLPHNMNLPELSAVDFKKGCFTGQEVIARMQYKGKLKSHMQQFRCHDYQKAVIPLTKLYVQDKVAGEVICAAKNSAGVNTILALLKDRFLDSKNFRFNDENGPILELTSNV